MTNEKLKEILENAPEGATHYDGKTYFRFEMFEHGQAYLILKNGYWDRGLPAYPVYGCHTLKDLHEILALREENQSLQAKIDALMIEFCHDEMTDDQLKKLGEMSKNV